ncbi:hypothetical protein CWI42_070270 [Ordospora colligata]|uniref:RRN7-type domain-containing protein n=1 Tax=Ordospora colligata OC4 TaxID=1354746 RepID=A0A0B2UED7_9MICR|nr:uncharacterized protein M896_070270 [Ordospora colligata OC4]KHN69461.1 hypothetical protein M896_070270 [Ordospora colligata OC4]TBU15205.1 hypothetical protein CWI41_070270 [Ordospora colligata]TBU15276.1 hypothetical protein CWI40_070270 [Ordospora colligata]TBU18458.1 hypothetical protein CWI42_070270 [Ordospora colligata]
MLVCDACGLELTLTDTTYVCPEGHILENKIEVENEAVQTTTEKIAKDILDPVSIIKSTYGTDYTYLLLFYYMFEDIRIYLGIQSSKYFDIFLNFIMEKHEKKLDKSYITIQTLRALTYYSKRIEAEAKSQTYLYLDYYIAMEAYPYKKRIDEKANALKINKRLKMGLQASGFGLNTISMILGYFGQAGTELRNYAIKKDLLLFKNESGIPDAVLERNKVCFRMDLRRDYKMMLAYLRRICEVILLSITKDLISKFKIFFYASDYTKTIHIPEIEICVFLYVYIMMYRRDFDVINANRNLKEVILKDYDSAFKKQHSDGIEEREKAARNHQYTHQSFQNGVKSLVFKITWLNYLTLNIKINGLRKLLFECKDIHKYHKKHCNAEKNILKQNIKYIKILMLQKISKLSKNKL